jgi:cytoskeletal protein CcmA (bactofilin family)
MEEIYMLEKLKFWKTNSIGGIVIGDVPSTLIGKGISMDINTLKGVESVRIDGNITGSIDITECLTIGETGQVIGNIAAGSIIIAGKVTGDINCGGIVQLTQTAKVFGNVHAPSIIIDEGAIINGKYIIGTPKESMNSIFIPIGKSHFEENQAILQKIK